MTRDVTTFEVMFNPAQSFMVVSTARGFPGNAPFPAASIEDGWGSMGSVNPG